jgi:hypothetical protein
MELHTVHCLYLDTLKVFMLCGQGAKGIFQVRLVNTVRALPSSFICPYFLTQKVPRYGNWTVIFPVFMLIKSRTMRCTQKMLKYRR